MDENIKPGLSQPIYPAVDTQPVQNEENKNLSIEKIIEGILPSSEPSNPLEKQLMEAILSSFPLAPGSDH